MASSESELREILGRTPLAGRPIAPISTSGAGEAAFAIQVTRSALEDWTSVRGLVDETGRWPVLTLLDSNTGDDWAHQVRGGDVFSRFFFEEEHKDGRRGDDPDAILAAAAAIDVDACLAMFRKDESITDEEYLELSLDETKRQFGHAPEVEDELTFLEQQNLSSPEEIERWLFDWEIANVEDPLGLPEHGLSHLKWFDPRNEAHALLLMPTPNGWDVPAYINWFASCRWNSQFIVALLREWNAKYGAELVAHYGTMVQLRTERRPQSAQEAFHLAWQQHMIAPCTTILPGVSIRNHARALLRTNEWFLHERP